MSSKVISEKNNLTMKEFMPIFWRSFALMGSFNFERMQALGFLWAIFPSLAKIYKDDVEALKTACLRHMEAFNMTLAPSPFVMTIAIAMEEQAKEDKNFNVESINALKVALMGPLSGLGDTFFWGIFRIISCALGVSFALQGNPIAPFVLLIVFNIPNVLCRWYSMFLGYRNGNAVLLEMQKSGKMELFTFCASIVGVASVGVMLAAWTPISSPLVIEIAGSTIVLQEFFDEVLPQLLPLTAGLIFFGLLRKGVKVSTIILGIVIIGGILGFFGIIA